jgi:hypothetical protein
VERHGDDVRRSSRAPQPGESRPGFRAGCSSVILLLATMVVLAVGVKCKRTIRELWSSESSIDPPTRTAIRVAERPATERDDSREVAPLVVSERVAAPRAADAALRDVEVRVRLVDEVDERGIEQDAGDGEVRCTVRSPEQSRQVAAIVNDGRFSLAVAESDAWLHLLELRLEGRRTMPESGPRDAIEIPRDGVIVIRARIVPEFVLRVRDAATGIDLDGVTVAVERDGADRRGTRPADPVVLVDAGRSPISLEAHAGRGDLRLFARAPGYAWSGVTADSEIGGKYESMLVPGGDLELRLEGAPPPADGRALLRLRLASGSPNAAPLFEQSIHAATTLRIESLPAEPIVAAVEIGPWMHPQNLLAAARIEIVPRTTTFHTLTLQPTPPDRLVPLAGRIRLPIEWPKRYFVLCIQPLDGSGMEQRIRSDHMAPDPARQDVYAFDAGTVAPGRYSLAVEGVGSPSWILDVPEAGTTSVWIEVPPPIEVSLRLVESATRELSDLAVIAWSCVSPDGTVVVRADMLARNEATGAFEFVAPEGAVAIRIFDSRYRLLRETLEVAAGTATFEIAVEPSTALHLELSAGGRRLPIDPARRPRVAGIDPECQPVGSAMLTSLVIVYLSKPGRVRVTIPDEPGYLPVPPFEVDVAAGEPTRHVVELTPRP